MVDDRKENRIVGAVILVTLCTSALSLAYDIE